ncbi:glycosyltransferase family protein [Candidatus Pelagibacter sp.]|uniref:glycosyltransferase family protein n=1 Tax=Candidatus Pelagibacter sp. TaxID=2024849 RepID=UPI003F848D1B
MNKKDQVGIFGLNYENNLENFYISAFKKLKYKKLKFFKNNLFFYFFCILQKIDNKYLFIIFYFFQNLRLQKFINKNNIKTLIVFKGIELNKSAYKIIKKKNLKLINIYTDDPFNLSSSATSSKNIIKNIKNYDLFFIWSEKIRERLEKKYKTTRFCYLPFGYSHEKHKCEKKIINKNKISFVGSYDKYRYDILQKIKKKVDIYGNDWPSFKKHKIHKYLKNKKLSQVMAQSQICLNILKKQNLDAHNMRTFEIPSMNGLMLATRSYEQNKFFPENKASYMFEDTNELNKKIDYILRNPKEAKKIRKKGFLIAKKHNYVERLKYVIRFIDET